MFISSMYAGTVVTQNGPRRDLYEDEGGRHAQRPAEAAYNVQHAVDAGFITWVDVSSRPGIPDSPPDT